MAYDAKVEALAEKLGLNYDTVYDLLKNGWIFKSEWGSPTAFESPISSMTVVNVFE